MIHVQFTAPIWLRRFLLERQIYLANLAARYFLAQKYNALRGLRWARATGQSDRYKSSFEAQVLVALHGLEQAHRKGAIAQSKLLEVTQ